MGCQPSKTAPGSSNVYQGLHENPEDDGFSKEAEASDSIDEKTDDEISLSEDDEETKKEFFKTLKSNLLVIENVKVHVTESRKCSQEFIQSAIKIALYQGTFGLPNVSPAKKRRFMREEGLFLVKEKGVEPMLDAIIHIFGMNDNFQYLIKNDEEGNEEVVMDAPFIAVDCLLSYIWNFTDDNRKVSSTIVVDHPTFLRFACDVLQQIENKHLKDDTLGGKPNKKKLEKFSSIFHNIARTGLHRTALRSLPVVEMFPPFLITNNDLIKVNALSVLAELMDENQAKSLEANQTSIEYLVRTLSKAVDSDDGRTGDIVTWDSEELAHVIRKIAKNDVNKKMLVNIGCLAPLGKLARSNRMKEKRECVEEMINRNRSNLAACVIGDSWSTSSDAHQVVQIVNVFQLNSIIKEQTNWQHGPDMHASEAVQAIWTLSFDEDNQISMIQESSGTIDLLLELHKHTDKKVKRASYGALWNMRKKLMESERYSQIAKEIFMIEPKMAGDQSVRNMRDGHVMISYQWGYQKLLKRIKECLRKNDINVWMDVDDMQGSTLDAMAKAVEEASIVLICFSQKYKDSDNCRAEAEYAYQLKKTIIPLKMELGYKPDGWLGIMCGTKLFYDFSGKYSFESKITDLVKDIQSQRNRYQTSVAGDTKTSPYIVLESTKPTFESTPDSAAGPSHVIKADENVMKWREEEVQDWVHTNDLPGDTFGKLEGADIAFLKILRREAPDYFYKLMHDLMTSADVKTLRTLRKFTFALENAE